jgi:hypothetical protein
MGDGILDAYPIIQDQTSPNLAHIPTTNLYLNSEPTSIEGLQGNITYVSYNWGILNFSNAVSFGDNSLVRYRYGSTVLANTEYTVSVFVIMNDNSEPTPSPVSNSGDFCFVVAGQIFGSVNSNVYMGNNIWRVSVTHTTSTNNLTNNGIIKYTTQSSKGFKVVGWQMEQQSQATAYIKSDGIAAVRKSSTTNLITYSEDLSQSEWVKASMDFVSNIATSPDGTLNATSLTNTTTGQCHARTSFVTATTGVYTGSAYLKKQDFDFVYVEFGNAFSWFNISNGTLGNTGNFGSGWTFVNHSIESVGNDWYRISITANNTTTGTYNFRPYQPTSSNGGYNSGLIGTSFIWGTQVEEQTQAETYAKTTGLPVTIDLFTENNYGTMTNMSVSDILEDTPNN